MRWIDYIYVFLNLNMIIKYTISTKVSWEFVTFGGIFVTGEEAVWHINIIVQILRKINNKNKTKATNEKSSGVKPLDTI